MAVYFGIRHLSPSGSWHLLKLLDELNPELVLIEGPSDLNHLIPDICGSGTKPPIAIMAYTESLPIRTILYPFAVYSPEYQAMLWAHSHQKPCRFIDLPSSVFLAIDKGHAPKEDEPATPSDLYERLATLSGESEQETYWERHFEHNLNQDAYLKGAAAYGKGLRESSRKTGFEAAETAIREAYMKRQILLAEGEGYPSGKTLVVTGAFHVAGLENDPGLTAVQVKALPTVPSKNTLMPYSYYRLSSRGGYGAGNKAPAYYELLWHSLQKGDITETAAAYLAKIAAYQRCYGHLASAAEVIEAVRLSLALAQMKGSNIPTLEDLRDGAVTCMGHGALSQIALAVADTEIGTTIGALPEGISHTALQADFYHSLKTLKLEKYRSMVAENLDLDLRENTRVKTVTAAFIDLNRSFFLHQLTILGIDFAKKVQTYQDKATWAEKWVLQWSPEAEIQIVESALKGDTVQLATAFAFKERLDKVTSISEAAKIIGDACLCGLVQGVEDGVTLLQSLAISAVAIDELATTASELSIMLRFGDIRHLDHKPLLPLLEQLFLRACLILVTSSRCDNQGIGVVIQAIGGLNEVVNNHDFLDQEAWIEALTALSNLDNVNTQASGYATAILLEKGLMDQKHLAIEVERRLSKGIPGDLGAGWFEGLAMKNKYALISRLSLWGKLDDYLTTLDDEEFKRALVCLRRAFASFSAQERSDIGENLGEIWGLSPTQVSEAVNNQMTQEEEAQLMDLEGFDFDDFGDY